MKEKIDDCQMITINSLNLRDGEANMNSKLIEESEIKEVKLFGEFDPKSIKVKKKKST